MFFSKKIFRSLIIFCISFFVLTQTVSASDDLLELHFGIVKLIRDGKSLILKNQGDTYRLLPNDRLQTGYNSQISLYLKNKENTVRLFSNSFFKLENLSSDENSVALLTGKSNFSVKPPQTPNEEIREENENAKVEEDSKKTIKNKIGGRLKGGLALLGKSKLRGKKKKRFNLRTVSAIVGVRGTEFVVATSGDSTNLLAVSGEVTLASPEIPDYEIPVLANEISKVREGSGPSVPVSISPDERDRIEKSDGTSGFQELQFGQSESIGSLQERLKRDDGTQQFEEEVDKERELFEQLDRLDELETLLENAENAIDEAKTKTLILSMTFANR